MISKKLNLGRSARVGAALAVVALGLSVGPMVGPGAHAQSPLSSATIKPVVTTLKAAQASALNRAPARQPVSLPFRDSAGMAALRQQQSSALRQGETPNLEIVSSSAGKKKSSLASAGAFQNSGNFTDTQCGCLPPDGGLAVGPSAIYSGFNTAFKFYSTSGSLLAGPTEFVALMGVNTGCYLNYSDPTGDYDNATGHFIIQILTYDNSFNSSICVAVSKTGDPTGAWYIYAIPQPSANDLMDYPKLAIASDAIYQTANQFPNGGNYTNPLAIAVNKSQLESGSTATVKYQQVTGNYDTLQPAHQLGTAAAPYVEPGYFVSVDDFYSGNSTHLWKWSDPFGANTFTYEGAAALQSYNQPINAPQLGGGSVVTNDARELNAYLYSGTVYATHAISCRAKGGATVDCVQWDQVGNIDGAPTIAQQGIFGSSKVYRFFPSIAVDKLGNMVIGYDESSTAIYPSIAADGRLITDKPGTVGKKELLEVAGVSNNPDSSQRWGDYGTTTVAPDGCTVYNLGEYSPANAQVNIWAVGYEPFKFNTCS